MENKRIEKQVVRIPIELFLDIGKMIQSGGLNCKVAGSNEATGEVILEVSHSSENEIQKAALKNLHAVVTEWNEYRHGSEDPEEIVLT